MKRVGPLAAVVFVLFMGAVPALRAQADQEPHALFQKVLGSVLQNDYPGLVSVCDEGMKDVVTPEMLADLHRSILIRFKSGYTPVYMGFLTKSEARIHYWKLVMKDRGDDVLMTLVVRNGLVSAFNLK